MSSNTYTTGPFAVMQQWSLLLTGSQSSLRDLNLTVGLVGLEGRRCTQLSREGLGTLGACGAGAGTVATIVRVLLFIHRYQLVREGKCHVSLVASGLPVCSRVPPSLLRHTCSAFLISHTCIAPAISRATQAAATERLIARLLTHACDSYVAFSAEDSSCFLTEAEGFRKTCV